MSDLGTMEQDISDTLQLLGGSTKIRHRILTSIRFHREKEYFFSQRTFSFNLTTGRREYRPGDGFGLPEDLVQILGEVIWVTPPGGEWKQPLERTTRSEMDWDRALEGDSIGEPELWDWWDGGLRVSPIPSQASLLEGAYLRDIGVPIKRYNTTTTQWEFFTPDGAATLTTDFTNHWFDPLGGYDLVKQRALHLIYGEVLQNPEMANAHMVSWLEEKSRLEDETEGKTAPLEIPPALW